MSTIPLSICIPTYNFGRFIGDTLASIIPQATDEVEIVVVDGASTDNTAEIVRTYQRTFPRLQYHLLEKKGGIDQDMVKTIDMAQGEYCWLFSADDIMEKGGLQRGLEEIRSGCDIYLCNRKEADIHLRPLRDRYYLDDSIVSRTFRLSDPADLCEYLEKSTCLGSIFSYMTSIVFRHDRWDEIRPGKEFYGSAYHHVYKLLSLIETGCTLKYIREPLVTCRMGNDSFSDASMARRVILDINGYGAIIDKLFSANQEIKRCFDSLLQREVLVHHLHPVTRILFLKIYSDLTDWKTMKRKINDRYGFHLLLFLADSIPVSPIWDKMIRALRKLLGRNG